MMQEVDVSVEVSASAQQESALPDPKQEPATMDEDSLDDFFSKKDKKKKKERKKKKKAAKAEAAESATNPVVVFSTTAGQFALEIFIHRTPVTASNFIDLVNRNFYNGICFHRVVSDFMIQAGCPNTRSDATFTKALAGKGNGPPNTEFAHLLTGEKLKRNSQGCIDDE